MKITTTRHPHVPCSQCLVIVRTDSNVQADRARRLTEAGISADEVERLLPTCPRCLRRRLRDLAVLEVMLQDFSAGGDVRSIAKSLGMRPWTVIASIGRLGSEGKLRGEWGWDSARRCLRWQGTPPPERVLPSDFGQWGQADQPKYSVMLVGWAISSPNGR